MFQEGDKCSRCIFFWGRKMHIARCQIINLNMKDLLKSNTHTGNQTPFVSNEENVEKH